MSIRPTGGLIYRRCQNLAPVAVRRPRLGGYAWLATPRLFISAGLELRAAGRCAAVHR